MTDSDAAQVVTAITIALATKLPMRPVERVHAEAGAGRTTSSTAPPIRTRVPGSFATAPWRSRPAGSVIRERARLTARCAARRPR